ncbi:hypothetical protein PMKS-001407 [Pichia membranifaciens]|uniref:Kinesin-like protein n=1 Tax=Pichia membranifaciens TaxID=4926 RepID=A0A1Q2YEH1_9ASCO|nr:hypothetical protein PMKS-001407 [Pichia membranifaciens]
MEDIVKLKHDKQNDLSSLNGEIWKVQTQIPDMELKLDELALKASIVRSDFQTLEDKLKNLEAVKNHKIQRMNDSLEVFKSTLDRSFDEKVAHLSQTYDEKVTNIINSKHLEFKEKERSFSDKITILKNSLADYSDKILEESKSKISKDAETEHIYLETEHNRNIAAIKDDIANLHQECQDLTREIRDLHKKIDTQMQPVLNELNSTMIALNRKLDSVQDEESSLGRQLKKLNNSKEEECNKLLQLKEDCRQYNHEIEQFNQAIKEEETYRRFLHNKLQEMKGNIRVFCRIKPDREGVFDHAIQSMSCTSGLKETLSISEPTSTKPLKKASSSPVKKSVKTYSFFFDKIFDENSSNADIFEEISQLVQSSLDGFNVCIFTYGQTGSGKTFTMSNANDGMIPRSMDQMFQKIDLLSTLGNDYQLYGQFFEIYGESIRDLIDDDHQLSINDDSDDPPISNSDTIGIKMIRLISLQQIESLLAHATKKRATAATMANDVSSRSHSIFKVHITKYSKNSSESTVIGTLNLVDLAGSERLSHSQVTGLRLKETLAINKSLSALGDVIASLKSKSSHVPYRNSKLTYILKDSLGGDSKTLMFVNISCLNSHFNESLSSLRFASKVNTTTLKK